MFSSGLRFCYKSQISHATIKRTGWQFQISLITLKISKFYKKKKRAIFRFSKYRAKWKTLPQKVPKSSFLELVTLWFTLSDRLN